MNQLLSIDGDKLVVEKLRVKWTEGPLNHAGSLEVVGSAKFNDDVDLEKNINIKGTIIADTINVKHIICDEPGSVNDPLSFAANTEKELDGRGFHFTDGNATRQFVYKEGGRLWSTMNLDLARDRSYQIEKIPVLTMNTLGSSVVNSNLKKLGELESLKVSGKVEFAEWAFFNNVHNRLGLNTENPNSVLSVVDNDVEIIVGSSKNNFGFVGTYNNSSLEIGTDNTARMMISNTGEVIFGNQKFKNAVVRIHGKLEVDEIINDPRDKRQLPITFKESKDLSVYGTGIIWENGKDIKKLVFMSNPDRISINEILDLGSEKYLSIDNALVLSKTGLGDTVTNSKLTTLGILTGLEVDGDSKLTTLTITDNISLDGLRIDAEGISVDKSLKIICDGETEFNIDSSGHIEIGNKHNTNRTISAYGRLSVGISNPDPDVAFTVGGIVSLNNKKFINSDKIPTTGRFKKGDVCWNTDPKATDYIGWVCIMDGTPGEWLPFGKISEQ